jgi:hypothetical protein
LQSIVPLDNFLVLPQVIAVNLGSNLVALVLGNMPTVLQQGDPHIFGDYYTILSPLFNGPGNAFHLGVAFLFARDEKA